MFLEHSFLRAPIFGTGRFIVAFEEARTKRGSISSSVSGKLFVRFRLRKQIVFRSLEVVGEEWKCEF